MIDEEGLRINVLFDNLDGVDYYALLQVPHDVGADALRIGFHEFALRFHPDQHQDDPHRQRKALAIFKRGAEAYRVLQHPVLRRRYDGALAGGAVRLSVEDTQVAPASTRGDDVPASARAMFDKARALLANGDVAGAKLHATLAKGRGWSVSVDALLREIDERNQGRR